MPSARLHLRGPDHTTPGAVAVEALDPGAAVGLTRGWAPKPYPATDPNEDTVALVVGARATLLVVADGHGGEQSSLLAVEAVLDAHGDDPPPDLDPGALVPLFVEIDRRIAEAAREHPPRRRDSATTLTVALVGDGHIVWASVGDSIGVVAAPGAARTLGGISRRYLGQGSPRQRDRLGPSVASGRVRAPEQAWVVLATDGYSDWAPTGGDPAGATGRWTAGAGTAHDVVDRLMTKARTGGAGDNVGIAVARVGG